MRRDLKTAGNRKQKTQERLERHSATFATASRNHALLLKDFKAASLTPPSSPNPK